MTTQHTERRLESLAEEAKQGNRQSFRKLVEETKSMAFSVAYRLLRDADEARDAAQESYIKMWEALESFDAGKKFTTWFYRIVLNSALDKLRSQKRRFSLFRRNDGTADFAESRSLEKGAEESDLIRIIEVLKDKLPETQRMVFILRDLQDVTTEETAEILGMSPESVKTNLHYARKRIREGLKRQYGVTKEVL